jgi:hypothetical protein
MTLILYTEFPDLSIQGSWVMVQIKLFSKQKQGLLEHNKYDLY